HTSPRVRRSLLPLIFLLLPPPPRSTLFPYTTLFRSSRHQLLQHQRVLLQRALARRGLRMDPPRSHQPHGRGRRRGDDQRPRHRRDRKSTRLNSSHVAISYAVFCLKKKNKNRSII